MSLVNTAPLAAAEKARDEAEAIYTTGRALRLDQAIVGNPPPLLLILQNAQTAYEAEVLLRTPGYVATVPLVSP